MDGYSKRRLKMKYIVIVLVALLLLAITGCDAFKKGFDEGYNKDRTEEVD